MLTREFFTTNIFRNFQTFLLKIFLCESSTYAQKWWQHKSASLFISSNCKKKTSKKRISSAENVTIRSVTLDEGKLTDFVFFDYFQSKLKMQNIFSIMNCKETYLSWNNLKE